MASQVKPWGEHSPRWQKTQTRKGLDPHRWDAWRKLAPGTRRQTNPSDYAKGKSVRDQIRDVLQGAAVDRLHARAAATSTKDVDRRIIVKNTRDLPTATLRRLGRMTPEQMDRDARRWAAAGTTRRPSPYWYHK